MELQRNTHHVYRLMYQFVWIPKYRHKVFCEPYREILKGIIEKAGYDYNIDIVELEIPEDHIHMVIRGVPGALANPLQVFRTGAMMLFDPQLVLLGPSAWIILDTFGNTGYLVYSIVTRWFWELCARGWVIISSKKAIFPSSGTAHLPFIQLCVAFVLE